MIIFKNIGTFEICITEKEKQFKIYDVPALTVGDKVLILKSSPKNATPIGLANYELPRLNTYAQRVMQLSTRRRLSTPLVCEPYVLINIEKYTRMVATKVDPKKWFSPYKTEEETVYHFVKKRNYNKYIVQALVDTQKIDYIVARPQQLIDKALNLGFIKKI